MQHDVHLTCYMSHVKLQPTCMHLQSQLTSRFQQQSSYIKNKQKTDQQAVAVNQKHHPVATQSLAAAAATFHSKEGFKLFLNCFLAGCSFEAATTQAASCSLLLQPMQQSSPASKHAANLAASLYHQCAIKIAAPLPCCSAGQPIQNTTKPPGNALKTCTPRQYMTEHRSGAHTCQFVKCISDCITRECQFNLMQAAC